MSIGLSAAAGDAAHSRREHHEVVEISARKWEIILPSPRPGLTHALRRFRPRYIFGDSYCRVGSADHHVHVHRFSLGDLKLHMSLHRGDDAWAAELTVKVDEGNVEKRKARTPGFVLLRRPVSSFLIVTVAPDTTAPVNRHLPSMPLVN